MWLERKCLYITEFARTWLNKISAFLRQLCQESSFITPIRIATRKKKRGKREKRTGIPCLIVSSALENYFGEKPQKHQNDQNGGIWCGHVLANDIVAHHVSV